LAQARLTNPPTSEQPSSEDRTVELEFWDSIKDTELRPMFEAYLEKYPDGEFRSLAEIRLEVLPG
jgi:adenylate cyclase